MNERIVEALMRLFAIVADVNKYGQSGNERDIVINYLKRQFSNELTKKYIAVFDKRLLHYHPDFMYTNDEETKKQNKSNENIVREICAQINEELEHEQKIIVLIHLIDFINRGEQLTRNELNFVTTVARDLKVAPEEFEDIKNFSFGNLDGLTNKERALIINAHEKKPVTFKHLQLKNLEGQINVLHIASSNTLILRYYGELDLFLNGHNIKAGKSYVWYQGAAIRNSKVGAIYYSKVAGQFINAQIESRFVFEVRDVEYFYGSGNNGIHKFSLNEPSGQLIGIIGGSGSGKSTLLNVLNGNLKPKGGEILINGYNIHENSEILKGVIGYVPQDDMLFKELTVYQNLYYTAKLSFKNYGEIQLRKVVEDALLNFDLVEARDLQVGNTNNTILSGGQRKRLNIALELMREPALLFVDEPTSGLSSMDSEKVMSLLKRQTFKGKLVFAILHQPSSDIFKLFDKLLVMDQGGRVIFFGNPIDAPTYFKEAGQFADAEENECITCGHINTEQILRIVESRVVDVNGRLTRKRKTSPEEWYERYLEKIDSKIKTFIRIHNSEIPKSNFNVPDKFQQIKIYIRRELLAKLANKQYLLLTFMVAPLLALILAFFTKHFVLDSNTMKYVYRFSQNPNIPSFLFMNVIVSLFLGLIISSEEIFKDRKILKRESFIHLSRFGYLASKISILFVISGIQMLTFIIIGNYILEIKGLTWRYWVILFTAACWANMIGLNISSGFNSIITIYILIPLILVPQLLFSGVVVDFNFMHKKIKSEKYVPFIGDLMTSRWAYEALAVTQFRDNKFEKYFYEIDQSLNNFIYKKQYLLPHLNSTLESIYRGSGHNKNMEQDVKTLQLELQKLKYQYGENTDEDIVTLPLNEKTYNKLKTFIENYDNLLLQKYRSLINQKEDIFRQISDKKKDKNYVSEIKNKYHNQQLENTVINRKEINDYIISDNEFVPLKNNIYRIPLARYIRAHFFAPCKRIGNICVDTFWFNIMVLWIFNIIAFVILYYDWLKKIIGYLETLRLTRLNNRIRRILAQVTNSSI